jgi:hypothetical protein
MASWRASLCGRQKSSASRNATYGDSEAAKPRFRATAGSALCLIAKAGGCADRRRQSLGRSSETL